MARIIENRNSQRRIIKLSVDDIISVVQNYQQLVPRMAHSEQIRSILSDTVIFLPEDV